MPQQRRFGVEIITFTDQIENVHVLRIDITTFICCRIWNLPTLACQLNNIE